MKWYVGRTVYFIESGCRVKEATIAAVQGELVVLQYDNRCGIRLRTNRLYSTAEEAHEHIYNVPGHHYGYRPPIEH